MRYPEPGNAYSQARLEWTLATALGFVLGMGLSSALFFLPIPQDPNFILLVIVFDLLSMIFIGLSVGVVQWFVIRKYLAGERQWILMTTLGWVVSLLLVQILFITLRALTPSWSNGFSDILGVSESHPFQFFLDQSDLVNVLGRFLLSIGDLTLEQLSKDLGASLGLSLIAYIAVFGGIFGAIIGALVGSMQETVIRRHYSKPNKWIKVSAAGWALGWAFSYVLIMVSYVFVNRIIVIIAEIYGLVIIGTVAGLLTGKEFDQGVLGTEVVNSPSHIRSAIHSWKRLTVSIRISALIGIVLVIATAGFGLFLFSAQVGANLFGGIEDALFINMGSISTTFSASPTIVETPTMVLVETDLPTQLRDYQFVECDIGIKTKVDNLIMKEKASTAIDIELINPSTQACLVIVNLYTPNFDYRPDQESQSAIITSGGSTHVSWVISPKTTGAYQIAIDIQIYRPQLSSASAPPDTFAVMPANVNPAVAPDISYTKYVGVVVTNTLGLTDVQATTLTYVGTFFGSSFTFPWLYTVWKERQNSRSQDKKRRKKRTQRK